MIFLHFYQVNILFLHQSYLKCPLPVKLTDKKCKNSLFIIEKIQNTESAQLWTYAGGQQYRALAAMALCGYDYRTPMQFLADAWPDIGTVCVHYSALAGYIGEVIL